MARQVKRPPCRSAEPPATARERQDQATEVEPVKSGRTGLDAL